MSHERSGLQLRALLAAVIAYGAASLFHHAHNAAFLEEYPNLPAWLTRVQVYAAWLGVTAVGVLGGSRDGAAAARCRGRPAGEEDLPRRCPGSAEMIPPAVTQRAFA